MMIPPVDSRRQQLNSERIIEVAAANAQTGRPMKQVKEMLLIEFALPNVWKLQIGNTIFIVHRASKSSGYFRAINADTAPNFLQNIKAFMQAAYQVGFDVVVTQTNDKELMNLVRVLFRTPPPRTGYVVQRTKDGGSQLIIKLGPSRERTME